MNADRLRKIRLVALDVDGVLTDGRLYYGDSGEAGKSFHVHDGMGVRLLLEAGIEVALITARSSEALKRRAAELGIRHLFESTSDKLGVLRTLAASLGVGLEEACYVGDDVIDVPALRAVGFAASVADAHPVAKAAAHWVASRPGGRGAVRQIADLILKARREVEPFGVIIPARFASTRLPGKPLMDLAGKPMILRVVDVAKQAGAAFVVVATDDDRILSVVRDAGESVVMTSPSHASGTDRLAEVVEAKGLDDEDIVVNVQGDEPALDPRLIQKVSQALASCSAGMATVATPIREASELMDPNVVKVTTDRDGFALAFSRAPIPWVRDAFALGETPSELPPRVPFLRHVGLYAYRVRSLRAIASQAPVALERAESLEQLRAMWLGIRIHVSVVEEAPGRGVDTEEDLRTVRALFEKRSAGSEGS